MLTFHFLLERAYHSRSSPLTLRDWEAGACTARRLLLKQMGLILPSTPPPMHAQVP